MKLYNTTQGIVIENNGKFFLAEELNWDEFVNRQNLFQKVTDEIQHLEDDTKLEDVVKTDLMPPISNQEVWASGVTYLRSRTARMEESKEAGGGSFYDRVYDAERPELFFKATAYRTVGSGDEVRIRKDSKWNVPEPELTLFICSAGTIEGYTVGNDMSSRDIEGENPLYLPQAKIYERSAALGPCLYVPEQPVSLDTSIKMSISRNGSEVYNDETTISRMKRTFPELAGFLYRECNFPNGSFLMTGTCLVPGNDFTLQENDVVSISIDHIGTLINTISYKPL